MVWRLCNVYIKKLDKEEMNNIFATKFVKLLLDEWFNGFRGEKSIEKEFLSIYPV